MFDLIKKNLFGFQSYLFYGPEEDVGVSRAESGVLKSEAQTYFINQLVEAKGLDDFQKKIVEGRVEHLIDFACFNLGLKNCLGEKVIPLEKMREIAAEISRMTIAVGNPFPLAKLIKTESSQSPISPHLQTLISSDLPSINSIFGWNVMQALLFKRNPVLLEDGRNQLKGLMVDFFEQIKSVPEEDPQTLVYESTIAYILSIYVHLCPEGDEQLQIPQLINGQWRLCDYRSEKIGLTPAILGSAIFAYGMEGSYTDDDGLEQAAPPNLIFKGTTFPTDDGAFLSFMVDVNPFQSVGEYAFNFGEKRIGAWLDKVTVDRSGQDLKARLTGLSLGGSLVLMSAEKFSDKIESGYSYNPPAIRSGLIKELNSEAVHTPKIRVLWQNRDVIPCVGSKWNTKWEVISVLGEKNYHPVLAHCKSYVAEEGVVMVKLNNDRVNGSVWRRVLTVIYTIISPLIFSFLAAVFITYRLLYAMHVGLTQIYHLRFPVNRS